MLIYVKVISASRHFNQKNSTLCFIIIGRKLHPVDKNAVFFNYNIEFEAMWLKIIFITIDNHIQVKNIV